ncbi:MAG TPA: methylenetetrahydrofolate reductase, partial [Candidatus Thermoplasmatota archaeon]
MANGITQPHPAPYPAPGPGTVAGALEAALAERRFALTAEITPPRGADPDAIRHKAAALRGAVDAVNVTDNQTARVSMSPLAAAILLRDAGVEPVLQLQTRDRNRLALQSVLLGASAHGIHNLLCLGGDPMHIGNDPTATAVHDLDATGLIALARQLRDEGRDYGGAELTKAPHFIIAGTCNPFGGTTDKALDLVEAKLDAGADFFQTQAIFDVPRFVEFLDAARARGVLPRARLLAGVVPL